MMSIGSMDHVEGSFSSIMVEIGLLSAMVDSPVVSAAKSGVWCPVGVRGAIFGGVRTPVWEKIAGTRDELDGLRAGVNPVNPRRCMPTGREELLAIDGR